MQAEAKDEAESVMRIARSVMPLVRELVYPRRYRMLLGLALLLVSQAAGLLVPYAPKVVIDTIIGQHQYFLLAPLFALLTFSVLLQAVTSFALSQLLSLEGQRLITQMRCRVHAHITRQPVAFFDRNKTGTLVSRVMNDVSGLRNLIGQGFIELIGSIITALFVLVILFHISVLLTVISLAFLAVLCGFLQWAFKTIRPLFRTSGKIASEVSGRLVECFGGIRLVKGYRAEARERKVFAGGARRLLENASKTISLGSAMRSVSLLNVRIMSTIVLCVGAQQVIGHHITIGSLVSYLMYLAIAVAPVTQMASVGTQVAEALAGLDRTREVLGERPEDEDPKRTIDMPSVEGRIHFSGVSFQYETGRPVLGDIEFEAVPGTVTALVGSSGSGKSTITALVAGFYNPTQGTVLVDGIDLGKVRLGSYRPSLGMVPQESFLFDGTIRENVIFSARNVTEKCFLEACRVAHVDEFVEHLKDKYETTIGERGVRLSGGQRQRISIARAILADPKVLILDEATSSLDSESEAFIQDGLRHLMKGRTTFVIAHRLSTAREADQILVVEEGRIVERGTHESLYEAGGRYFDLYSKQHDLDANRFEGSRNEEQASPRRRPQLPGSAEIDGGEHGVLQEIL